MQKKLRMRDLDLLWIRENRVTTIKELQFLQACDMQQNTDI
jgi:hypothetical protein